MKAQDSRNGSSPGDGTRHRRLRSEVERSWGSSRKTFYPLREGSEIHDIGVGGRNDGGGGDDGGSMEGRGRGSRGCDSLVKECDLNTEIY